MPREIVIDGTRINDEGDCWVIAEVGHNHQGSLEKCKELFRAAKECGANAVKLQKRDNRALYTRAAYDRAYESENAFGPTYGAHREALEFNEEQYRELQAFCREIGITFFATAFDAPSADMLARIDVPAFKVASGDLKSIPLLKHIAKFGKPMIISTGGATLEDVDRAYRAIKPINSNLAILQCTAAYPADFAQLNLKVISAFRERYPEQVIGLSDHDNGIAMSVAACVLGARIIEKHFTLNRASKGTDHAFSLEPVGLRKMVRDLHRTRVALGTGIKAPYESEKTPLVKMGKKVVAARDLEAGAILTLADVTYKSPGDAIHPYQVDMVLGRVLRKPLKTDDTITFEILENGEARPARRDP